MTKAEFLYVTLINAPREKVWAALTNGEFTRQYWHKTEVRSDWIVGSGVEFLVEAEVGCEGEVLVSDEPRSLSYSWHFPRNPACASEAPSRVLFTLEDLQGVTKLTVRHDEFDSVESNTYKMIAPGWPYVLAGLKSLCETGQTVDFSTLDMT